MPQLLSSGATETPSAVLQAAFEAGSDSANSSSSSRGGGLPGLGGGSGAARYRAVVAISSDEDRDRIFYDQLGASSAKTSRSPSSSSSSSSSGCGPSPPASSACSSNSSSRVPTPRPPTPPAPAPGSSDHYGHSQPTVATTTEQAPDPGAAAAVAGRAAPNCPPPPPKPPAKPPQKTPPPTLPKRSSRKGASAAGAKTKSTRGVGGEEESEEGSSMMATALGVPDSARWCGADGNLPKVVTYDEGAIVNGYLLVNGSETLDLPAIERGGGEGGRTKRFHVSGMLSNGNDHGDASQKRSQVVEERTFAGSRDVKDPDTLRDLKIVSAKGTIRGVKNRVRAGIATFIDQDHSKNYRTLEKGKILIYVTSMRIIRETYERCQKARMILQTHMVCFEEVDIFMSKENQRDLMARLGTDSIVVPQVFADGQHLGGLEELEFVNESGELRQIFQNFKKVQRTTSCEKCGGYRFVNCPSCHGSKKSLNRNHFTEEFCALRCVNCDENGLVRCDACADQSTDK